MSSKIHNATSHDHFIFLAVILYYSLCEEVRPRQAPLTYASLRERSDMVASTLLALPDESVVPQLNSENLHLLILVKFTAITPGKSLS